MRKALIAAIVAAALFAVGAFAAEFTLNADDVASGEAPVNACASEADVAWSTTSAVGTDGEFMATGATITFTQTTASPTEGDDTGSCAGQQATIAVGLDQASDDDTSDVYEDFPCGTIAGGVASCTFSPSVKVSEIEDVSVLAGGTVIP